MNEILLEILKELKKLKMSLETFTDTVINEEEIYVS